MLKVLTVYLSNCSEVSVRNNSFLDLHRSEKHGKKETGSLSVAVSGNKTSNYDEACLYHLVGHVTANITAESKVLHRNCVTDHQS